MTSLIACLSTGKGSWMDVFQIIDCEDWERIYLITNEFGREKFKAKKPVEFIIIDTEKPMPELVEDIRRSLYGKINDLEAAVNITSGSGKEHMAMISAILKLGLAIRYVAVQDNKLIEV
ncbi:hypothetical protein JXB31_04475 [Candidatus Woesearchaeota archaeon]|nr:hypothetical protein [Candidatus Woesearchaeota archaeon]